MVKIKIPKTHKEDKMFNRRLLAYYGLVFSVYWVHLILVCYIVLTLCNKEIEGAVIISFLGTPAAIAGLGFWKYLKAAEKDDKNTE